MSATITSLSVPSEAPAEPYATVDMSATVRNDSSEDLIEVEYRWTVNGSVPPGATNSTTNVRDTRVIEEQIFVDQDIPMTGQSTICFEIVDWQPN